MTRKPGPARAEEQAELRALRARTAADARQAGDTVATLAGRLTESARPPTLARQAATALRTRTAQATRRLARRPVVAVRGRMAVVVGVPSGVLIIAVAVVLWQHRRAS
ncbi:MAG TPA: hypothetical protein VFQ68_38190 [Streptosporangiaceae bacterium]|nr:hypothetical protein [Streptosporangiaceae bacterium]